VKIIGYKTYLKTLVFLIILGMTFSILRLYGSINLIRVSLLLMMFNNLWFIIININKIKLKLWSLILLCLIAISFIKGLIFNDISDRTFTDIFKPVSFIFIFHLFSKMKISRLEIEQGVKQISIILFRTSLFFAIISFALVNFKGGYAGVRLPIALSVSYFAVHLKKGNVFISILAIIISGKRAILLAIIPVLFIGFNFKLTFKKVAWFLLIFSLAYILIASNWNSLKQTRGLSKFTYSIEKIEEYKETKDLQILNIVSAKRIQEITSGMYNFSVGDYFFGKGVGYTYDLYDIHRKKVEKTDQGNMHFSPASLIASYGIFFMLIFYVFFIKHIRLGLKSAKKFQTKRLKVLSLFCFAIFIESFFAYVLFVIPLLPVLMGMVSNEIRYLKNK